jgi:hypothetical protein
MALKISFGSAMLSRHTFEQLLRFGQKVLSLVAAVVSRRLGRPALRGILVPG